MNITGGADEESQGSARSSSPTRNQYVSNPEGRNQFPQCPSKTSEEFLRILKDYHRITTSRTEVRALLSREHGIEVSERTISRRWQEMGLKGSKATEANLAREDVVQLVVEHINQDLSRQMGQNALKRQIALRTGVHLKRKTVAEVQKMIDPEGVAARHPSARQIRRVPLLSAGPNEVWCCDGHDKLCKFGFAIWGIRDKFSRKWLGLWVVPNNRIGDVVSYLWLSLVHKMRGVPKQTSSDCGSENIAIYGLANALKEAFNAEPDDKPAHIFLRSVHHIPIERGWLDLRRELGHNIVLAWEKGKGFYKENNPLHRELVRWLWPPLLQKELDRFCDEANNKRVRKQRSKALPSGVSPHIAYTLPERYGGTDCLQEVDLDVISGMLESNVMQEAKAEASNWGVTEEFAERAEAGLEALEIDEVTFQNVWLVFSALLLSFI